MSNKFFMKNLLLYQKKFVPLHPQNVSVAVYTKHYTFLYVGLVAQLDRATAF